MQTKDLQKKRTLYATLIVLLLSIAGMTKGYGSEIYTINASANPLGSGTVTGSGNYYEDDTCTLIASANEGYVFVNWTVNGNVVSSQTQYSFVVTQDVDFVANFITRNIEGAINGLFTVNDNGKHVFFSRGNLQYLNSVFQPITPLWKFADHQWDYLGTTGGQQYSGNYHDRDLFGWGTGGGTQWMTSIDDDDYLSFTDWGTHSISNGGNESELWVTLSMSEWEYIFNTRSTVSGKRFVKAKVNNVNGVILLPDNWNDSIYSFNNANDTNVSFGSNVISVSQWEELEIEGAVFLPASGYRDGIGGAAVHNVGSLGYYWSNTPVYHFIGSGLPSSAGCLKFYEDSLYVGSKARHYGFSVRLVLSAYYVQINHVNPASGGTVTGAGWYGKGSKCRMVAAPNDGYYFLNWTKNGTVVCTEPEYVFTVTQNVSLVANFTQQPPIQPQIPTGAIDGLFTINNDGAQVYFSQGNLQYIGYVSDPYWKFAEHQWEYIGSTGQGNNSQYANRDLFGWGTSGYNHGATIYQPWLFYSSANAYYAYGSETANLNDQSHQADWGYNPISNGGNILNKWRTLTNNEWDYLFNTRYTPSGIRYAKATVNDVNGVILLPDNWSSVIYSLHNTNVQNANFTSNNITDSIWNILESHGAVFLPTAGYRDPQYGVRLPGLHGYYWSASCNIYDVSKARCISISNGLLGTTYGSNYRYIGQSVRLVCPAQNPSYTINAMTVPSEGGTITGEGTYEHGSVTVLIAEPSEGYTFVKWMEDGKEISIESVFPYTVTHSTTIVAVFAEQTQNLPPEGAVNGLFTVNGNGNQVYFSKGNLQYIGNDSIPYWKFADTQWGYLGNNGQGSTSQTADRDLFGWGTSGFNHGAVCYQPWSTSESNSDYFVYSNADYSLFDQTGQADWGYNLIINGGNQYGLWRTMTIEEWQYVLNNRITPSGICYAKAKVIDVNGVIVLPDNWDESIYLLNNTNDCMAAFSSNIVSAAQWSIMEYYGAVFLPASGCRSVTNVSSLGSMGQYWSSSKFIQNLGGNTNYLASSVMFYDDEFYLNVIDNRGDGLSVRLIQPYQAISYSIEAIPSPAEGGMVSGEGTYVDGEPCTLTAIPNEGYVFVCWTQNNEIVSMDTTFTFFVMEDASFVANFEEIQVINYIISASVNPSVGGIVSGTGSYVGGQTCTLTAAANEGYTFINWTKNNLEVSTQAEYSFNVTENAVFVANFASDGYYWVEPEGFANSMTVVGIIMIDSVEQHNPMWEIGAFHNEECRGRERLVNTLRSSQGQLYFNLIVYGDEDGDEITFRLYDHINEWEMDLECATVLPFVSGESYGSPDNLLGINFISGAITQTTNFSNGWNWWSSYVELDGANSLQSLQNGLGTSGMMIKSQNDGYASYLAGYGWYGSLTTINNENTYQIRANEPCSVEMTGAMANPFDHPITLNTGWTWVGYPVAVSMSVENAFAGISPLSGDMLKSQNNGFASYLEGFGWYGSLSILNPGMGLMFKSNNSSPITLVYPNNGTRTDLKPNQTSENNHWRPNLNAYPDNMSVMAVVELDGEELALRQAQGPDNYELAVFANGECRGSARLMYVEPLNRYMAFLTVAGDEAAELRFGLYNTETGEVETQCITSLQYETNAVIGSFAEPYVVRFRGTTGVDEWANSLNVFPNPVERGQKVSLGFNDVEMGEVQVEIINVLGTIVETRRAASLQTITAPETAGVYTLRITVEGKGTCYRKLVVE